MNKRLIWNFEIDDKSPALYYLNDEKDSIRWEARYFWPDNTIIPLHGLNDRFLTLSHYEIKHREDSYMLLTEHNYNIKQRFDQLLYKPVVHITDGLYGYGKKINLKSYPADEIVPGTPFSASELLPRLRTSGQSISVVKDVLIYRFPTAPTVKLELARLTINKTNYLSACLEGRSYTVVKTLAKHLLKDAISCDYVHFLKQILNHGK
ncbi:hypothetical protein [Legionella fairfieldensis]|uniref:hypothetical protein n=1 Tax=Legionella fairfieldensis TaxID=45064 RepID=UPI00048F1DC8|nr:hypothetical protein [Legionella fairfieldensis]